MNENSAHSADPSATPVRTDVTFPSGRFRCAAWYYTPCPEPASRVPVVVLAHGFGGTRHMRLDAYARVFAKAGYAALVFDYRHFGDSEGEPRQLLDIPSQLEDWKAALGLARTLPHVDADRVVAWGTSLGGGHVLTLAAEGLGLAAAIAQVPHVSGPAAAKAVGFWQSIKLGMAGMTDALGPLFGRRPYLIPIVGAPGDLAAMTAAGSLEAVFALQPESKMLNNAVAARIMLQMSMYSPMKSTHRIACPLLVQIAKRDAITPSEVAAEAARRAPRSEVRHYDWSHFEPYVEPAFQTAVTDQLAFLQRHVPVASATPDPKPDPKPEPKLKGRS